MQHLAETCVSETSAVHGRSQGAAGQRPPGWYTGSRKTGLYGQVTIERASLPPRGGAAHEQSSQLRKHGGARVSVWALNFSSGVLSIWYHPQCLFRSGGK